MSKISIGLIIIFLSFSCFGAQRTLIVPDNYPKIQQAIDAARSGDTVEIKPGIYDESLIFKDGINLRGTDRNKVIIRCDAKAGVVLQANDCDSGTISDLIMTHTGVEKLNENDNIIFPILQLKNSSIQVIQCIITGGGWYGIMIEGKNNCEITECSTKQNKQSGILVTGNLAKPLLKNNWCIENQGSGIYYRKGASGIAENNICKQNDYQGIFLKHENTAPFLRNNQCFKNSKSGIYYSKIASGTAINNTCNNNTGNGIVVSDRGTQPILTGNSCFANKRRGIYFRKGAQGTADRNICYKNKSHGISVANAKTTPTIINNECFNNGRSGIFFAKGSYAKSEGNIYRNNGEISFSQIRRLLMKERFEQLEQIASRLRTEKTRFKDGSWQLRKFYKYLGDSWTGFNPPLEDWLLEKVRLWIKEKPESITPRIVMAKAYLSFGWNARGSGFANTVTEEGWKVFYEKLRKAKQVLIDAEKLSTKDPELYSIFLTTEKGLGKSGTYMDRLFEKGIAVERTYYYLYYHRAHDLLPRWHGKRGELEAFMDRAVELTKDVEGESLYARIANRILQNIGIEDSLTFIFSYKRIKQGHIDILKRYPEDDYYLNTYCLFASIYKDKETARELFDKIRDDWNKSAWDEEKGFNKYRSWAYDGEKSGKAENKTK